MQVNDLKDVHSKCLCDILFYYFSSPDGAENKNQTDAGFEFSFFSISFFILLHDLSPTKS